MSALPFSKIFAPFNALAAAAVPLFLRLGAVALVEIVRVLRPRIVPTCAILCRKGETGDPMLSSRRPDIADPAVHRIKSGRDRAVASGMHDLFRSFSAAKPAVWLYDIRRAIAERNGTSR